MAEVRLKDLLKESEGDPWVARDGAHSLPPLAAAPEASPDPRWLIVKPRALDGEEILVVFEKKYLKEAENAHPDLVAYFPPEIEELRRHSQAPDFPQFLKTVHAIKKHIGGWIVPSCASRMGSALSSTRAGGRTPTGGAPTSP